MDYVATSSRSNADNGCGRDYTSEFSQTNETFNSRKELENWARKVGRSNDFTIVVLRSDSGNGKKKPTVTLGCERSGKVDTRIKSDSTITTDGRTKKCDCPFRLLGSRLEGGDEWELIVVHGMHNHEVGHPGEGHSFRGSLTQEEEKLVQDWLKAEKRPKEILRAVQAMDKHNKSTPRTIYNACQRFKRIKPFKNHCSWLQQIMSSRKAKEYKFIKKQRTSTSPEMDTALNFFLTHPTSLKLLLAFPTVLIIEFSLWSLPSLGMLEIFGVTSTGTYFAVGLAIVSLKDASRYEWAMSSLRAVINDYGITMPDAVILIAWEDIQIEVAPIMKAIIGVFSRAKLLLSAYTIYYTYTGKISALNGVDWNSFNVKWKLLKESRTEADLEEHIKQLRTEVADSVIDTWVEPYKKMFVRAWTDKVMHFGNRNPILPLLDSMICRFCTIIEQIPHDAGVPEQPEIDKIWKGLYELIENVNKDVIALLEDSLVNEYNDQDGFPELKELHGTISIHALTLIREQTVSARKIDVDSGENCGCVIRSTHGLPCAHDIANYKRENRPIPLECINPHWRTLELKPLRKAGEVNVEGSIKRRRVSKEMNRDTHYVLTLPDIVESKRNSPNAGPSIVPSTQERQLDDEVYVIPSTKQLEYADICPHEMRPYILDIKDVPRDGHCGFRAIASFMGYGEDVGWVKVREDLRNELLLSSVHYALLFGSDQRVNELFDALACYESVCLEKKHWMTMPDMGHIIASCYNIVLIHLSSAQCFTFFPLRTAPISISVSTPIEIVVGFVRDHFVQLYLKEGHPMPPPVPTPTKRNPHARTIWERIHEQRSTEWVTVYLSRIGHFKSLQPEVASRKKAAPVYLDLASPNLSCVETVNFLDPWAY